MSVCAWNFWRLIFKFGIFTNLSTVFDTLPGISSKTLEETFWGHFIRKNILETISNPYENEPWFYHNKTKKQKKHGYYN